MGVQEEGEVGLNQYDVFHVQIWGPEIVTTREKGRKRDN